MDYYYDDYDTLVKKITNDLIRLKPVGSVGDSMASWEHSIKVSLVNLNFNDEKQLCYKLSMKSK